MTSGPLRRPRSGGRRDRGGVARSRVDEANVRLQRELELRLRQQEAVAAVGQKALGGASFAELLDEIVDVVQVNLDVDVVGYLHCTDDPGFIRAMAGRGWPAGHEHDGRVLPVAPGGLTDQALARRAPMIVDDVAKMNPTSPVLLQIGARSSILVPIYGRRPLGLFGVHSKTPRHFTDHDAAFLAAAANVVAVAHARLEAEATTRHRALHDSLTDLPNRVLLHDRLEQAIFDGRRNEGRCALLLMDLDGFKGVNDTLGHSVGDSLLKAVAERLRGAVREVDTVARLGGDEFAIVLRDVADADDAVEVARKVLRSLEDAPIVAGMPIPVDASVGVAVFPEHGESPATLLQRADVAMYRAKRMTAGVEVYDDGEDGSERERLGLAGELRSAIDDGQLRLVYQPKVSARDGRVVGVEALLRWAHPTRGMLLPGQFLPVVEPTATILALSRWVVREAVSQGARWRRDGLDIPVAVNCSARWLQNPEMAGDVLDALVVHDLPADRLVVEVTESAVITNPGLAMASVDRLVAAGVRLSIDDFGTGFSSLAQLERLPVAELKIDRSFVAGLHATDGPTSDRANRHRAIVQAVVGLGRRLGLDVVAEGVETAVELRELRALGCEVLQGFLLAAPVAAADLPTLVATRPWSQRLSLSPLVPRAS